MKCFVCIAFHVLCYNGGYVPMQREGSLLVLEPMPGSTTSVYPVLQVKHRQWSVL